MSVRRWRRVLPSGKVSLRWVVDIEYRHKDGTITRLRRFPRIQTRVAAERLERELLTALENPPKQADARQAEAKEIQTVPTIDIFWQEYFTTYVATNNKPSEQAAKRAIYTNHLRPIFGQRPIGSITSHDIERFKAHKLGQMGYAPKTVNNQLTVLRGLLSVARRWGVIASVPSFAELKVPEKDLRFLSATEASRLIKAAVEPWRTMIVLCLNTGLRIGELLGLQWGDVDLRAHKLTIRRNIWRHQVGTPKSGRIREVPLNSAAADALTRPHRGPSPWLFPRSNGLHQSNACCRRPLHRACRKAGIPDLQWHVLRHTFASHLVATGTPLRTVQKLLGHANYATTERYAHLAPRAMHEAVDTLCYISGA